MDLNMARTDDQLSCRCRRPVLPQIPICALGRAGPLRPDRSDIDFLGDLEGVVDFDAKITHRAFDLGMAERLGFILRIS
jgi:hypothetical protein